MPKSCAAPECKRSEGARESYYKFPLHDKVRLKQWLANMNVENFFPSKNQYLCSRHFKPSCFQFRWGVRYLKHDAVPTVFSSSGVPKMHTTKTRVQNVSKELCLSSISHLPVEAQPLSETLTFTLDPTFAAGQMSLNGTQMLVTDPNTLAIPTTMMGAVNLIPLVHIVESFDGLSLALAPSQGFTSVAVPIEAAGQQQTHAIPLVEPMTVLSEEHIASTALQQGFYEGQVLHSVSAEDPNFIELNEATNNSGLVIENISIEPFFEAGLPTPEPVTMSSEEVISYLETMQTATVGPTLAAGPLPPLPLSTETVLSTSITRPIPSTLPIVSEHSEAVGTCDGTKQICLNPTQELPETLTTAELVSVVVDLQKKVKTLQQRHQKHCSKLEVMEGVVEQLKKENLISDENLNFLGLACLNPDSAISEDAETIAIVCQDDSQPVVYTIPFQADDRTVFHITDQ